MARSLVQRADALGFVSAGSQARDVLAQSLADLGCVDEAFAVYRDVIERAAMRQERSARPHEALWRLYKLRGDYRQALAHHEAYLADLTADMTERANLRSRILMVTFELDAAEQRAERAAREAQMQRDRAEQLDRSAQTDALTGASNRRCLDAALPSIVAQAQAQGKPRAAALFDADHFKRINDGFGHAVGDRVLVELVRLLTSAVRSGDLVVRMGGEEFLVIFVGAPHARAVEAAERARAAVERFAWAGVRDELALTVSVGVDSYRPVEPISVWLERVDGLLYAAKSAGRNRVVAGMEQSAGDCDRAAADPQQAPARASAAAAANAGAPASATA
jgi:diguanylate cyclase (GGDEF)-like protein